MNAQRAGLPFPVPQLAFHRTGRPVLSSRAIEAYSLELLQRFFPQSLVAPTAFPFFELIDLLKEHDAVQFRIEDLPQEGPRKVLGVAIPNQRTIILDPILFGDRSVSCPFVVAHEVGHWLLHRHRPIDFGDGNASLLPDDEYIEESCRSVRRLLTPRHWVEWQANHFASTLVLPRDPLIRAVEKLHQDVYPVTKNFGIIYKNRSDTAEREVNTQLDHLARVFNVSRTSVKIRLRGIGRYVEQPPDAVF